MPCGVSVEALSGYRDRQGQTKARGTRMQRHLQQIASLPPEDRGQIMQLLDALIDRGLLKRRAGNQSTSSKIE